MIDATVRHDLVRAARARADEVPAEPQEALRAGTRALARRIGLTYATLVVTVAALALGAWMVLARSEAPPPSVFSLVVTPSAATVGAGDTVDLVAVASYSDGSDRDVTALATWQSSAPDVATVDTSGTAVGTAPGASVITATWSGRRGSMTITVPDPIVTVTALNVTPQAVELTTGQAQLFTAVAMRSDGSIEQVTEGVVWNSSDPAVASVAPDGGLTARAAGSATITASYSGVTASADLTVRPPDAVLVRITVTPTRTVLAAGATQQLTALATFDDGRTADVTDRAAWRTGDSEVASVDDGGEVLGVGAGSTTVTATLSGRSTRVTVTVENPAPTLTQVIVTPEETNVCNDEGLVVQLKAVGRYDDPTHEANGTTPDGVRWSSDDESIAVVDDTGRVEVKKSQAGTLIRATVGDVSGTARVSCFVVE